jgi:hypothetical protein
MDNLVDHMEMNLGVFPDNFHRVSSVNGYIHAYRSNGVQREGTMIHSHVYHILTVATMLFREAFHACDLVPTAVAFHVPVWQLKINANRTTD